jgi:hypothetical protein
MATKWAEESAKNCSFLRQMALNLLKKEPTKKSIRTNQKMGLPWISTL